MEFRRATLDWSRVYIAGVVNVTPDSFSDGGDYLAVEDAVARARALVEAGADIVDIGGESTRPGAQAIDAATEIDRVVPVIQARCSELSVPLSIDTTKAEVARAALAAGAEIVNDISGGAFDPAVIDAAVAAGAAYICGHVRGHTIAEVHASEHERDAPGYEEVAFELAERVARLPVSLRHRTIVDPGLGFGKRTAHNVELTRLAGDLGRAVGCPVMVGPSRKRFIRALTGAGSPPDRAVVDGGTVGACLAAVASGANILRVHNVELLKPALMVYETIVGLSL